MPARDHGHRPVYAIPKALQLAGLKLDQIGVIELNEAFAAQSLSVMKELGLDPAEGEREWRSSSAWPPARMYRRETHGHDSA